MSLAAIVAAGTTLAGGAGFSAWAGLSDESQAFGRSLIAPDDPRKICLTFDDGPNPAATPQLLEVLAKHRAKATFFFIGDFVRREPTLAREVMAAGHTVGNHTQHHLWLPRHPARTIREELRACNETLEDTLGVKATLFRPPHGARRPAVFRAARELGLQPVQWNLMVGDWKGRSAENLYRRLVRGIAANRARKRGTSIVLHDGSQHALGTDRAATVAAVGLLLKSLPSDCRIVTLPEWLPCDTRAVPRL
jgi:peptidoglycan/xylan/chitin deacetylase (PgdA/CDA1 family)